jgi:hypothetical protein
MSHLNSRPLLPAPAMNSPLPTLSSHNAQPLTTPSSPAASQHAATSVEIQVRHPFFPPPNTVPQPSHIPSPHPKPTPPPSLTSHPPAYPLTCPSGYDCISTMQDRVAWACCNQIQCVGNYRTCAGLGAGLCDGDLGGSECSAIYTSILSCSDIAAPSCFLYARSTSLGDLDTQYSWGCGASGSTVLVLATTTGANGEVAASTSTNCEFPTPKSPPGKKNPSPTPPPGDQDHTFIRNTTQET